MGNDEKELIAHIISGDHESYRFLVDRYKDGLYRHCFYIVHDEDSAEDVAQEAFIRAFMKLDSYDPAKASFKTWLFTIATRLAIESLRRRKDVPLEDELQLVSTLAAPDQRVRDREVYEAVQRLRPKHRAAVLLYYWHGYQYDEIARYMDVPIGSVCGWLHRAKQQLKEALS